MYSQLHTCFVFSFFKAVFHLAQIGNPGPLGLYAFGFTTALLQVSGNCKRDLHHFRLQSQHAPVCMPLHQDKRTGACVVLAAELIASAESTAHLACHPYSCERCGAIDIWHCFPSRALSPPLQLDSPPLISQPALPCFTVSLISLLFPEHLQATRRHMLTGTAFFPSL